MGWLVVISRPRTQQYNFNIYKAGDSIGNLRGANISHHQVVTVSAVSPCISGSEESVDFGEQSLSCHPTEDILLT